MADDKKQDEIQFLATFPATQGAIRISGNGDGMRIQLDIPETEMGTAARLLLMREKVLKVTVGIYEKPRYEISNNATEFNGDDLDDMLRELDSTPKRANK